LSSFVYFALGYFVGTFSIIGLLIVAGARGKKRRGRRAAQRRAVVDI
jgi:hypothetical protein